MKILHITSSLDGGGIARLLVDYCSRMLPEFQFDFVITSKSEGFLERQLRALGCNIYHIEQFRINPKTYMKQLSEIINNGHYNIVHNHADYRGYFALLCAKKCGVNKRIAHSHLAFVEENTKTKIIRHFFTFLTKGVATDLAACSNDAAIWMWGENEKNKKPVHIMVNALETEKFRFSSENRNSIRKQLGLEYKYVIGNVARFTHQKNHDLLIKIFHEIHKERENAVLLLVGDGELTNDVKLMVDSMSLMDDVIFLGTRDDVPKLLSAMDVFVLPSRFEGLGMVYVEAQANGLQCFGTKNLVPEDANIQGGLKFIPLDSSPQEWADQILRCKEDRIVDALDKVVESGFDIDIAANDMRRYYLSL